MKVSDLKAGAFLKFHVKKGVEIHATKFVDCVSIRSDSITNMIKLGLPLAITVKGEEGVMILHTNTIEKLELSQSVSKFDNDKYHIKRFKWSPDNEYNLSYFNGIYGSIKYLKDLIKTHQ